MKNAYTTNTSNAQLRRELKAEKEAYGRNNFIEDNATRTASKVATTYTIWRENRRTLEQRILSPLQDYYARWLIDRNHSLHRARKAAIHKVAIHEAAHFAADEAAGFTPFHADIGGRSGYSGTEVCTFDYDDKPYPPLTLIYDAAAHIIGGYAEHILAEGEFDATPFEIIVPHFLAARASELKGLSPLAALHAIAVVTVSITSHYRHIIEALAETLEKRRSIDRSRRSVKNAIRYIGDKPLISLPRANMYLVRQLLHLMHGHAPGIDDLIAKVTSEVAAWRAAQ